MRFVMRQWLMALGLESALLLPSPRAQVSADTDDYWRVCDGRPAENGLTSDAPTLRVQSAQTFGAGPISSIPGKLVPPKVDDAGSWDPDFHAAGMNSPVSAMAVYQDKLVLGGDFTFAGSVYTNFIISWDDSVWSCLGSGMNGTVLTLTEYAGALIAGGDFFEAGGIAASRLASWDGSSWSALGSGVDHRVLALNVYDGWLIAGGEFENAGGAGARHLARWDGTHWEPLLNDSTGVDGVNGLVNALVVYGGELVAAGWFDEAGGVPCNGVARWNGTSWRPLGTGVNTKQAQSLGVYGDELIVGGQFGFAGGVPVNAIASWDGQNWHAMGSGVGGTTIPLVGSFGLFQGELIVGGIFPTAGDIPVYSIARWDGLAWHPLGSGFHFLPWHPPVTEVSSLAVFHDRLYAGGLFFIADDFRVNDVAAWDGNAWAPLDPGLGVFGEIRGLAISGSDLIAGGAFLHAGSRPANHIARLTARHWEPLGAGTDGDVRSVLVRNGSILAGGEFLHAGGIATEHVASWDGTQWQPMGAGLDGTVASLCTYRDTVIAGGSFTGSGTTTLNGVARWDGSQWQALGGGMSGPVACVYVSRDTLYAGGDFEFADGVPARYLAFWTGSAWKEFEGGTNGPVMGLGSYGGNLVIGGRFWNAGTVAATGVALWDGGWHALGEGLDLAAFTFLEYQHSLYVGGEFHRADGLSAWHVARWDGSQWHTLGEGGLDYDGVNRPVYALTTFEGELILGGAFGTAANTSSIAIAGWNGTTPVAVQDFRAWVDGALVRLQWRIADADVSREVVIERSDQREGPYETLARLPVAGQRLMEYSDVGAGGTPERWYRLNVLTDGGSIVLSEPLRVSIEAISGPSAIDGIDQRGEGQLVVRYHIQGVGAVPRTLRIFDVGGRLVRTLEAGSATPGVHQAVWPTNSVARGVYFATLTADGRTATRKFVLERP